VPQSPWLSRHGFSYLVVWAETTPTPSIWFRDAPRTAASLQRKFAQAWPDQGSSRGGIGIVGSPRRGPETPSPSLLVFGLQGVPVPSNQRRTEVGGIIRHKSKSG